MWDAFLSRRPLLSHPGLVHPAYFRHRSPTHSLSLSRPCVPPAPPTSRTSTVCDANSPKPQSLTCGPILMLLFIVSKLDFEFVPMPPLLPFLAPHAYR